jgi:hypothetical protein
MHFPCRLGFAGIVIVGTLLLAGVVHAERPDVSGVEGVVSVSPSRPGPARQGESSSAPAGDLKFIVKNKDERVGSFTTDAQGHFRVSLPEGHYTVLREDPGARPGHWHFEVDVAKGQVTKVTWTGDSGMR